MEEDSKMDTKRSEITSHSESTQAPVFDYATMKSLMDKLFIEYVKKVQPYKKDLALRKAADSLFEYKL